MDCNVFFSWQDEKPLSSNCILKALKSSCEELSSKLGINLIVTVPEACTRKNCNSSILGSSIVTVADMTPTSMGFDGRLNPNANVIYEYALSQAVLGSGNVIVAINLDGIQRNQIPFDFNDNNSVLFHSTSDINLKPSLKVVLESILASKLQPVIHDATTVFFTQRIACGFPGVRNIKWYTDTQEIKRHLDAFFKKPITFRESTDREGDKQPLCWFRGGSMEAIDHYESLPDGVFLIGYNEFKIKGIAVYADHARYFREYIYIEAIPMHPFDKDYYTPERIEDLSREMDYVDEEYAVIKEGNLTIEISRAEYDDGYADINGEIVPIHGQASLRCRFLTPFNIIVAAKYSPYNSSFFSSGSDYYFNGLLKGSIRFDEFHKFLKSLPKYF